MSGVSVPVGGILILLSCAFVNFHRWPVLVGVQEHVVPVRRYMTQGHTHLSCKF